MKKIIFATGNPTKAKRFSNGLVKHDIEVISLKDLDLKLDVDESGNNAIENALKKARACFEKIKMPTIGMDDTLYLENGLELQGADEHFVYSSCNYIETWKHIKDLTLNDYIKTKFGWSKVKQINIENHKE